MMIINTSAVYWVLSLLCQFVTISTIRIIYYLISKGDNQNILGARDSKWSPPRRSPYYVHISESDDSKNRNIFGSKLQIRIMYQPYFIVWHLPILETSQCQVRQICISCSLLNVLIYCRFFAVFVVALLL